MTEQINKDALLDEITRRVIQIDGQRQFDQDLRNTVNAYIDALNEITHLSKADIEAIAQQVIAEYQQPKAAGQFRITRKQGLVAGGALFSLILLMAIFTGKYFGLKEGLDSGAAPDSGSQANNRAHIIRVKLSQVIVQVTPLKTAALEHYQTTLKFPSSFAEIGYNSSDFIDGKLITALEFTAEGGILLELGSSFDPQSKLLLQSNALQNGAIFKWTC
jgi:hypothetical protein